MNARTAIRTSLAVGFNLILCASSISADAASDSGKIKYYFPQELTAEEASQESKVVKEGEPWLVMRAAPFRLARLKLPFEKRYGKRVRLIKPGEFIFVSAGENSYGCAALLDWTDTGELVPCFADLDNDGSFEGVILKKTTPEFNSYPGSVSVDDLERIAPLPYDLVTDRKAIEALSPPTKWQIEQWGSAIQICEAAKHNFRKCLNKKVRIVSGSGVQRVELAGGVFLIQPLGSEGMSVKVEKLPSPILF